MVTKKILWALMIADATVALSATGLELVTGQPVIRIPIVRILLLGLPFVFTILHAVWNLDWKRAVGFLGMAALIGFVAEVLGVNFGLGFGGQYKYRDQPGMIFGVPITVPIYWAIFIYTSYVISSSSFGWFMVKKPSQSWKTQLIWPLLLLDGLLTMNIDMALDPVQTLRESWEWETKGPYFGIPIGNFIGWFLVAAVSSGIFRYFESRFPQSDEKINDSAMLLPTIGYGLLAVTIMLMALRLEHPEFALIAVSSMIPITILNLILFFVSRNNTSSSEV